jgi:hypothetical protein
MKYIMTVVLMVALLASCSGGGGGIIPNPSGNQNVITYTWQQVKQPLDNGQFAYIDVDLETVGYIYLSCGQQYAGDGTGYYLHYKAHVHFYDANKKIVLEKDIDESPESYSEEVLDCPANIKTLRIITWSMEVVGSF